MLARHILFFLVILSIPAYATHNRAGEITYEHIQGLEYRVILTTYTKTSATAADRPELEVKWGDGHVDTLARESITPLLNDAQKNIYTGTHVYAGPGTFVISMEDPNRNEGVVNIPSSVSTVFYIESVLTIDVVLGHNNSVVLTNSPLDNACIDKLYIHNTGAFDPDGDSLSFQLVDCKALDGLPIPGYTYPDQWPSGPDNQIYIDQQTGDFFWDTPQFQGEYNIAILIKEWRQGYLVGTVLRDMQITVFICDNNPPEIVPIPDTCILAGELLLINVEANDPDNNPMHLDAFGEPFEINGNEALFEQFSSGFPAEGTFTWIPDCERVRLNSYAVNIKAKDFNTADVDLVDFETFNITVIAPGPEDLVAEPFGNTVDLTWSASECSHASGYNIYRRPDSLGYEPDYCVTGVPASTGYSLVGSLEGIETTAYTDNYGLALGQKYCYMVTATFPDGAESQPSLEACATLIKDLPVITNVSVGSTDIATGRDTIVWSNPTELNPVQYPGPYHYKVFHAEEYNEPSTLIYTSPVEDSIIGYVDTAFVHLNINSTIVNSYRIDLYSNDNFVGSTYSTPSIFLSTSAGDNKLTLNINDQTPWIHYYYEVYRFDDNLGEFIYIDSTLVPSYVDTGLVNLTSYCYYVKAIGGYASNSILPILINYTQETCGIPWDNEAPCPPELTIESDCEAGENYLMWTNPNNYCADDVMMYTIYYKAYENSGDFVPILTIDNPLDTSYLFSDLLSVAGCYAVTASDSLNSDPDGNISRNESEFSNIVCVENCPDYVLPNVFTPNGDGTNDLLTPVTNRQVESIVFTVYNRWGTIIFESTNPEILWDGKDMNSNEDVSDGVYFYTVTINAIKLSGNETTANAGYIYIFRSQQNTN